MLIPLIEYAKRHDRDPATARQRAGRGCFKTAVKMGRDWFIEENEPWNDGRIKTGAYKNFRKKEEKPAVSLDITPQK